MYCCLCNVDLKPHYHFDANTPIGLHIDDLSKPSPDYYYCPNCGLMYQKVDD
jgi:hypothetical protein